MSYANNPDSLPVLLAANVVLSNTEGAGTDPPERLEGLDTHQVFALVATAANDGIMAGLASQAPTDDRLTLLGNALRTVHTREMFGDCTEDGDPYPCRTIRALDIVGAGTPVSAD